MGGTTTWKWRLGGGVLGVLGPSLNISSYGLAVAEVTAMAASLVAIATLAAAIM
jgi:hypothetical protein